MHRRGAGIDNVLDETTVNSSTGAVSVTGDTITQNSTVAYDTGTELTDTDILPYLDANLRNAGSRPRSIRSERRYTIPWHNFVIRG